MNTIKISKSAAHNVSELTLKQAPARLLAFLQAVAADPAIRTLLREQLPWSEARAKEGWALLASLEKVSVVAPDVDNPAADAMKSCEAWQSTGLVCVRSMLEATHPDQAQFLFHDFVSGRGMEAVSNVSTFLARRERLAHGPERKATRKADAEALAVINESGTTKETLKKLEAMVEAAQSVDEPPQELTVRELEAIRLEALREIHAWVTMWSNMARSVITLRSQMIRLGIAKRRTREKAVALPPAPPVVTPPVVTAPIVTAPAPTIPAATTPVIAPPSPGASTVAAGSEESGPESRAA